MHNRRLGLVFFAGCLSMGAAQGQHFTLESSLQRALDLAPELRAADAAIAEKEGTLQRATAWPNPNIELRVDDRIGKETGAGGIKFSQLAVSQAVPLTDRRQHLADATLAALRATQAQRHHRKLMIEADIARIFHTLQLATAKVMLAKQRLELADLLQTAAQRREQAGELARLERIRLDILREQAHQATDREEGEYGEALAQFRSRLALNNDQLPELTPLSTVGALPTLESLRKILADHPAIQANAEQVEAAQGAMAVARTERIPDLSLRLFHDQDFINGQTQSINGVGVAWELPLWDRNAGRVKEAGAQLESATSDSIIVKRDLNAELDQSYLHLGHLILQARHFHDRVLTPAQEMLTLTRRGYEAGEAEILFLVDANDTYFDAQVRYIELLYETWIELARLRLATGQSALDTAVSTQGTQP